MKTPLVMPSERHMEAYDSFNARISPFERYLESSIIFDRTCYMN
jgi:hypothetical protein